jgi:SAM-dependent methyltransferase
MTTARPYLLDNSDAEAARRMEILAQLYDTDTRKSLAGVGLAPGWNCLEVGGGGGSVAAWMAECCAPGGSVLCTDIDPRHIEARHPNLRVERHDITQDPLPPAYFDLIHARLVLMHIPARDDVLTRLVAALKPGGWLVIEDFDVMAVPPDISINPAESQFAATDAMRKYMTGGGADPRYGRRLFGRFQERGLVEVDARGCVMMFAGHNAGVELMRVNFEQIGAKLVEGGLISADQLAADLERISRGEFVWPSPVMWTVAGRRPPS